jgi:hypothetical protein
MTIDSITKAATHLTEIGKLSAWLEDQALHRSDDRLMPGGRATVALAHVGSPREWAENIAADELYHLSHCTKFDHSKCRYAEAAADEDNDGPVLQDLLFWSEAWRDEHGYELDRRPTIATEANFLRGSLEWAWANEPHWDDFVRDLESAQTKLENLLMRGVRAERGVPCMYDECKDAKGQGKRLVRKMVPGRDKETGLKTWRLTNWHCPRCHREWDEERYRASIAAAAWSAQSETIGGQVWCTAKFAARQVGRTESCVRGWIAKHGWATVCLVVGRRIGYVNLAEVEQHAAKAKRRGRAA